MSCYIPDHITVRRRDYDWSLYLYVKKQVRLARAADRLELMDPIDIEAAGRSWPIEVHRGSCECAES